VLIHAVELDDSQQAEPRAFDSEKIDPDAVEMFRALLRERGDKFTTEVSVLELPRLSLTWQCMAGPVAVAYFRLKGKPALLCLLVGSKKAAAGRPLLSALQAAIAREIRQETGADVPEEFLPLPKERPLLVGRYLPLKAHTAEERRMIFDYAACLAAAVFCHK
jgi:hypothetical protein